MVQNVSLSLQVPQERERGWRKAKLTHSWVWYAWSIEKVQSRVVLIKDYLSLCYFRVPICLFLTSSIYISLWKLLGTYHLRAALSLQRSTLYRNCCTAEVMEENVCFNYPVL